MRSVALVSAVVAAMLSAACATPPPPERTVERFLAAVDRRDPQAVLGCVSPSLERVVRLTIGVADSLTLGLLPVNDVLQAVPGLIELVGGGLGYEFRLRDVHVYRATVREDAAEVPVTLTAIMSSPNGDTVGTRVLLFTLRNYDVGWRIVGVRQKR